MKLVVPSISGALAEAGPFLQMLREKDVAVAEQVSKRNSAAHQLTVGINTNPTAKGRRQRAREGCPAQRTLMPWGQRGGDPILTPPPQVLIPIPLPPWGWLREHAQGSEPVDLSSLRSRDEICSDTSRSHRRRRDMAGIAEDKATGVAYGGRQ